MIYRFPGYWEPETDEDVWVMLIGVVLAVLLIGGLILWARMSAPDHPAPMRCTTYSVRGEPGATARVCRPVATTTTTATAGRWS